MSASKLNTILADPTLRAKLEKRFWSKVDRRGPEECWPWTAKAVVSDLKYGAINLGDNVVAGSHRVAFALANGSIDDGMHIRHSCDNPPCCNPAHLLEGTHADNYQDMLDRGRHYAGEMTPDRIRRAVETRKANRAAGKHSQSSHQRKVASEVLRKRWADPEWRKRWSENMSGEKNPTYGRAFKHTDETKLKIGAASKGRPRSPETREKQRLAALARPKPGPRGPVSEETRARMRIAASAREAKKREQRE